MNSLGRGLGRGTGGRRKLLNLTKFNPLKLTRVRKTRVENELCYRLLYSCCRERL